MDIAKDIFLDALDLHGADRQHFLDRTCGDDGNLRSRVIALIAAHERADRVINQPTAHPWTFADPAPAAHEPPGTVIGEYVVERVLGEGGFGTVYLAQQEQPVRRLVALKVVRPGMHSRDVIRRFELERQALAVMDHPGIAKVYDAGTTPNGQPFFAMEYVNGKPITEFADASGLTIRQRLELFEVVCLAVQHAHGKGVIHRDLKPSNILVSMLDGKPYPTIIDFGIAKALHALPHAGHVSLTLPQQIIGTPQYMAPEQASLGGDDMDIDTRADVYGLGAILYELLVGRPVFEAEQIRNLRPSELERIICEVEPPRPSARAESLGDRAAGIALGRGVDAWKLPRMLSGELDWICMRALEKDRARRYPTSLSLAEDVRRYLKDEAVEACPPTLTYRVSKFARRHRVEFVAAGTVALALVAFACGSAWFAYREYVSAKSAKVQLARAESLQSFAEDILSGVDPAEARGSDTKLLRKILAAAEAKVGAQLADQPAAAATMLNAIGHTYYQLGDLPTAEPLLQRSIERHAAAGNVDQRGVWSAQENLAAVYIEINRFDDAHAIVQRLFEERRRELGPEHADTIKSLNNVAYVLSKQGRIKEAREKFEEVAGIRTKVLGANHVETLNTLNNLASVLDDLGEYTQTVAILERVVRGQTSALGADHPKTLQTMNNLASAYQEAGRSTEACELYKSALETKRRIVGSEHPSTIATLNNYGVALTDLKRFDEAEPLLNEALTTARKTLGSNNMRTVACLNSLAKLHNARNRADLGEPLLVEAVDITRTIFGERHPGLVVVIGNLSRTQSKLGKFAEAEKNAREAIALASAGKSPAADCVTARRMLALSLDGQRRYAEAAAVLLDAIEMSESVPETLRLDVTRELSAAYQKAGNLEQAAHWNSKLPATQPTTRPI